MIFKIETRTIIALIEVPKQKTTAVRIYETHGIPRVARSLRYFVNCSEYRGITRCITRVLEQLLVFWLVTGPLGNGFTRPLRSRSEGVRASTAALRRLKGSMCSQPSG